MTAANNTFGGKSSLSVLGVAGWIACAVVCAAPDDLEPERAALLTLLESRWNARSIAETYPAERITPIALDLASNHPEFARGKPGRQALVHTLLLARSMEGNGALTRRGERGDFVFAELVEGGDDVRIVILSSRPAFSGPYQASVCEWVSGFISNAKYSDFTVLVQSLRVFAEDCPPNQLTVGTLRMLVVDPPRSADAQSLNHWRAQEIPFAAARALLATAPDLQDTVDWLADLQGEARLAAREAFLLAGIPGSRFERIAPELQQKWVDAFLEVLRSTIDRRQISQDEFAVFVSVGERFPQFRQDIGDLFEELLTDPRYAHHHEAMTRILDHWSKP